MADEMERRLQAAYASGDAEAIMRCLNGDMHEAEEEAAAKAQVDDLVVAASVCPASTPGLTAEEEIVSGMEEQQTEEDCAHADQDEALSTLRSVFPHADVNVVQSLLYAHAGDLSSAQASLEELDEIGALGVAGDVSDHSSSFDTEGFAAAVAEWDTSFPSLGRSSTVVRKPTSSTYGDGKLISSMRERHLVESLPWIPQNVVQANLKSTRDANLSRANLLQSHPKPSDWDVRQAKKADAAILAALQRASRSWSSTNDYDEDIVSKSDDSSSRWVSSGDAVSKLYASCRERASAEARQRNKHFELASKKARAGNGAEAARLGSLGRAANARMKALHDEAADLLWNANNSRERLDLIDCHGLHISEALERLPGALNDASSTGRASVNVVFGTGHHSKPGGGAARLRPAIIQYLQDAGYSFSEVQDKKTRLVSAVSVMLR